MEKKRKRKQKRNSNKQREIKQQQYNGIDIGSSNSKSNYVDTNLKHPEENENKKIGNNVGYDWENLCETRES